MTKFLAFQVLTVGLMVSAHATENPPSTGGNTITLTNSTANGSGAALGGENLLATFGISASVRTEGDVTKSREGRFTIEWGTSTNRNKMELRRATELSIQNGVLVMSGNGVWTNRIVTLPTPTEGMRGRGKPTVTETRKEGIMTITITDGTSEATDMLNVSFAPPGTTPWLFNGGLTRGNVNFRTETKTKRVRATPSPS